MVMHLPPIHQPLPCLLGLGLLIPLHLQAQDEDYPTATATETPGIVRSPYPPNRLLDVQAIVPGSLAEDPDTGEVFRVPLPEGQAKADPPATAVLQGVAPLPEHVERFVRSFVATGESDRAEDELAYYADHVKNYFGKPGYRHADILQDRREFIERWPERSYRIQDGPVVLRKKWNGYDLMVRILYAVAGPDRSSSGGVTTYLTLRETSAGLKITHIEERRAKPSSIEN